jgi:AcrR family transcriptional regulator
MASGVVKPKKAAKVAAPKSSQKISRKAPATIDDTRTRLLTAAMEVFAEVGYEQATVRQICSRANANLALVNYYFGDKLELYTAVLRYAVTCDSRQSSWVGLAGGYISPEAALRQMIRGMVDKVIQKDQVELRHRLMMHEFIRPTSVTSLVIKEVVQPMYDALRQILATLLELPMDHELTRLCTHSVLGQVVHYSMRSPMLGTLWPDMKLTTPQREMVANHVADFSLAYIAQVKSR